MTEGRTLEGKHVFVAGGTTGIGLETAIQLAEQGAHVAVLGRHEPELDDALERLHQAGEGRCHGFTGDISRHEDVLRAFESFDQEVGPLDVFVASAALAAQSVTSMGYDEWRYVIDTNLVGTIDCVGQALERMKQRPGHIVVIGSLSAHVREAESDVYVATKSGLQGFCEALRKKVQEQGVKVTLIEPGLIKTDMTVPDHPDHEQKQKEGKMGYPTDIARAVLFAITDRDQSAVLEIRVAPVGQGL